MSAEAKLVRRQNHLQELSALQDPYKAWLDRLPSEQKQKVAVAVSRRSHGLYAVAPLQCFGCDNCPFISACPLVTHTIDGIDKGDPSHYPIGLACVLESHYMAQTIADYTMHLEVDPSNPVERAIVDELAVIDLLKNRALLIISHGDSNNQGRDLMKTDESVTGVGPGGVLLTSKTSKLHPALEYVDKLERRREKWLDRLMETRKAKADWDLRLGSLTGDSPVLAEITRIREFMQNSTKELEQDDTFIGLDELLDD